jgi:hypothetical protein
VEQSRQFRRNSEEFGNIEDCQNKTLFLILNYIRQLFEAASPNAFGGVCEKDLFNYELACWTNVAQLIQYLYVQ